MGVHEAGGDEPAGIVVDVDVGRQARGHLVVLPDGRDDAVVHDDQAVGDVDEDVVVALDERVALHGDDVTADGVRAGPSVLR